MNGLLLQLVRNGWLLQLVMNGLLLQLVMNGLRLGSYAEMDRRGLTKSKEYGQKNKVPQARHPPMPLSVNLKISYFYSHYLPLVLTILSYWLKCLNNIVRLKDLPIDYDNNLVLLNFFFKTIDPY